MQGTYSEQSHQSEAAAEGGSRQDLEKCKDLIRAVVNMKLDFEQAKYMFAVMKELRKKPLEIGHRPRRAPHSPDHD